MAKRNKNGKKNGEKTMENSTERKCPHSYELNRCSVEVIFRKGILYALDKKVNRSKTRLMQEF